LKVVAVACAGVIMSLTVLAQNDESLFKEAKKAVSQRQWDRLFSLKDEMVGHPLYPYLDYFYIRHHFYTIDDEIIKQYIDTYPKSPMANKLRKKWLYEFADKNQWEDFLNVYQPSKNVSLQCLYLNALYETGNKSKVHTEIKPLWLTAKSQPDRCNPIFSKWLNASQNKDELVWERFEITLLEKKFAR